MGETLTLAVEDRQLLEGFTTNLDEVRDRLVKSDARFAKIEADLRTVAQKSYRPPGSGGGNGGGDDSIGALVVKDGRFQTLQSAGRGIAQVTLNRRLAMKAITTGPTLKPGVTTLPIGELPGPGISVADLIPQRSLTSGTLQFVRQTAPHPVAGLQLLEGDIKAEGALVTEVVELSPATLAIWVQASRQALRDIGGLSLIIDSELLYAIRVL